MNDYSALSAEYYDPARHPTIANLRSGSLFGFRKVLTEFLADGKVFCETGSGRGTLPILAPAGRFLVCFDLSDSMLRSNPAFKALADSYHLPLRSSSIDGLMASLCDPYNTPEFYAEARRVLKPGRSLAFSVPYHSWVHYNQAREGVRDAAVVRAAEGKIIVPSFVYEPDQQRDLLYEAGFEIMTHVPITIRESIPEKDAISSRLRNEQGGLISEWVVSVYLARVPCGDG